MYRNELDNCPLEGLITSTPRGHPHMIYELFSFFGWPSLERSVVLGSFMRELAGAGKGAQIRKSCFGQIVAALDES